MVHQKVLPLRQLAQRLEQYRQEHPQHTIIHCHGVFDLLHIGHLRHFKEARQLGDLLVVTLTPDHYVNKGPNRPAFTEALRAEAIASLEFVDYVAVNEWPTAIETIKLLKPNLYVKGSDYKDASQDVTGKIVDEVEAVRSVGGDVAFTDDIVFSSSSLINRHLPTLPTEVRAYLDHFREHYSIQDIEPYLSNAGDLKVLVVGETILDEYVFCKAMGSSTKEPILSVEYESSEKFAGGVLAMANHIANFCQHVGVLTMLGQDKPQLDFVEDSLNETVERHYFFKEDSPTIVKRRFVESYLAQKLFQIYEINNTPLSPQQEADLCAQIQDIVPQYDVVIVVDYGHWMLSENAIEALIQHAPFLAVNTQANAGNRGFNTISKYRKADFISLASHEISLEERNRSENYHAMIKGLQSKIDCPRMIVTRGKFGILGYTPQGGFVETPAFGTKVVDRMGTGDAVLSIAALMAYQNAPMELIGFVGNAVGAQAVATLGHERSIDPVALQKFMITLLK